MPATVIDGIATRYEVVGSGPPLLMFSPAGFDATVEKWSTQGVYAKAKMMDHLPKRYRCILYDRREAGQSGGRVERVNWSHYVAQAKGLLDHLGIERAFLMGGCMGCSPVMAFAVAHPASALGMILYWPVGGAKYRIAGRKRFDEHLSYAREHGLAGVVALAASGAKSFGEDPRAGPWVSVIRRDRDFAESYARHDLDHYLQMVGEMGRGIYDRDTSPGAEPEDLLRLEIPALIVPGRDPSHATSAARYLEECLPRAEYWDVLPEGQTEATASPRLLQFLDRAAAHR